MQAWEQFLQLQEIELGTETVQKWLRSLKILRFDACNLYLEAKDSFQALWFEEHIRGKAQAKLVNGNNKGIKIHLSVAHLSPASKKNQSRNKNTKESKPPPFQLNFDELDPHFLFQHFIVSQENQLTHKLLCEVAGLSDPTQNQTPLGTFNPIYLYGPSGSGKTHLLASLTQAFRARGLRSIYVRAELFTDHVVSAIRAGEMSTFRQAYRNTDILLVDDVHVFSRKRATQEEFFHTFNTLHLAAKQIILTANCPPQELQLIEPRLVSRFEWGIVLPLNTLSTGELKTMLQTKGQVLHFLLPTKVIDFLLETFTSNPKALVKAFEALVLRLHLDSQHTIQNLTVAAAKTLLSDLLIEEQKSALTLPKIIQAVAKHYGIRTEDILGKSRTRECALPRQLAMHLCREKLKMPYMKIGDLFSRDHSTVMVSIKQIQKWLDEDHREIAGARHAILNKLQT
jgi:chromosomal replication initiator protein